MRNSLTCAASMAFFAHLHLYSVGFLVFHAVAGCLMMSWAGILAAVWADKFDQLAAFQNFVIVPLTFLSGVFYSVHSLPPFWLAVSHANPFFYMIDGFRYGFFGNSDVPPETSLLIVLVFFMVLPSGRYRGCVVVIGAEPPLCSLARDAATTGAGWKQGCSVFA